MQNAFANYVAADDSSLENVDFLMNALERVLLRHRAILKEEGIDRQLENLKHWLEINRKCFNKADTISETGHAWLSDICDCLKLSAEERQRLESEGGQPATKEEAEKTEELLRTIRRIENILHRDSVSQ